DEDGVRLMTDAFVPHQGFAEKAFYFGHNLHDHAAAAASNLLGERAPFLERSVHYTRLPAAVVAALAEDAEGSGMRLLKSINRKAQAAASPAADDPAAQRFTFGIYFYAEKAPPTPPEDTP
ncbi:MAG TPA: hypothetical protein VFH22_02935, partial [Rhodocyclaceae bacterium]|nr:hypothetical protein [Rhodocyclaceae bacterium]